MLAPPVEPAAGGAAETIKGDVVLVAIGRRPNTEGLGLEAAGVEVAPEDLVYPAPGEKLSSGDTVTARARAIHGT